MNIPAAVGPYRIERELGRGGMGVVYLAHDERLDRTVAVKALAASVAGDPARISRFRSEARLVAQLNHPHIAQIHDVREEHGHLYLVLEYVPGESLAARLERGPMPPAEALEVCAQVARAIGAAHARGVIHRDLKPDNIRITPDGTAKVLDFGIAKALDRATPEPADARPAVTMETVTSSTQAGSIIGTPGYMSPEQARGREVEKRADVWAFGCILYECLAGSRAFQGQSIADTLAATLIAEPKWTALPGATPPAVVSLLHKCLVKDVEGRLADIAEASARLEEALGKRVPLAALPTAVVTPSRTTPSNLPRQMTAFIGREDQLAALRPLIDQRPLVTLLGAGGCGKTRLALRLASEMMAEFPGGVHLVELAALTDPSLVPSAAASARGDREQRGQALTETIAQSIGEKRALLILDNCEHLRGACSALATALLDACPNLRIMATGREALGVPGETTWRVPSLSLPPATEGPRAATPTSVGGSGIRTPSGALAAAIDQYESVALFCDRARAVKPAFALTQVTGPVVARICRRLDGIPLAIELAAARIKLLTPEQILARLDDRFRLLTGGAVERHQTLRATIDWSYAMLTPEEASLLRTLSVFAGGWTLEGGASVSRLDEFEALELLTRLVDKSLVVVEEGADGAESRYRLLETVRQYSWEKVTESGQADELRDRHQEHFVAMAEQASREFYGPEAKSWLDRLEMEHDNLLAAIAHGRGTDRGARIAMALGRYWYTRGYAGVGRAAITEALARGGDACLPPVRARALNAAASLAHALGDLRAARDLQTTSLAIYRELDDKKGLAASLNNVGIISWNLGELDQAADAFAEALSINRSLGSKAGEASNLANLATFARARGDLDTARARDEESLALNRITGNALSAAGSLNNLALVAQAKGEADRARRLHAESLSIRRRLSDRNGLAESLMSVAGLAATEGAAPLAARLLGAAERLREEIGLPVPAFERERYEAGVRAAREALQAHGRAIDELWRTGRDSGLDAALTEAAEWLGPFDGGPVR